MDVGSGKVVTNAVNSSVDVSLHPLVIMNISDHYTRVKMQQENSQDQPQVYGALLGTQKGRSVEICNSFELVVSFNNSHVELDKEYFTSKEESFKQVFTTMDFVGWYTIGSEPSHEDAQFHQQISTENENSLLLKLHPLARNTQHLPISIYESLIEIVDGVPKLLFTPVPYSLATEEAERIGVDHIARTSMLGTGESSAVAEQLGAQHGAVKMLYFRVRLIMDYLRGVQAGDLPKNHEILREISSLCDQLPILESRSFEKDFFSQTNDVLLMSYLAAITKGISAASEFITKANMVYDRHNIGRRTRGLLF